MCYHDEKEAQQNLKPWKYYPGNSRIFCNGRLITSRNSKTFLCAIVLIMIGFVSFSFFEWIYLYAETSVFIPTIDALLFIIVISLKLKCALMDPGFIKRDSKMNYEYLKLSANYYYGKNALKYDNDRGIHFLVIPIKGYNYKTKYCTTCNIFRPPRAKHCSECDACVLRQDHHCPWLMNCIGERNYKYFFAYLNFLTLLIIYQLGCSIFHIALLNVYIRDHKVVLKEHIPIFLSIIYHLILGGLMLSLLHYHFGLATTNVTTNEDVKNILMDYEINPFLSKKANGALSKFYELQSLLCTPTKPSVLDLRGKYCPNSLTNSISPYQNNELDRLLKVDLNDPVSYNILNHYKYTKL